MPGRTRDPLDDEEIIIRVGLVDQTRYDVISAAAFAMSEIERKRPWKRISAWAKSLTTDEQAVQLVANSDRKVIIKLRVENVRQIAIQQKSPLDAVWDQLPSCIDESGTRMVGYVEGCEGHCAITGIDGGSPAFRKQIRKRLADLGSQNFYIFRDGV